MTSLLSNLEFVLSATVPVFIIIGLGYSAFKFKLLPEDGVKPLGGFVFNFGLPAAIYSALSKRDFSEIAHYDYLIAYTLGSFLAFALVILIARRLFNKTASESVIFGMGGSFSNTLLVGYPVVLQVFGDAAIVPLALTLIVENLLLMPVTLALADAGEKQGASFFRALLQVFPRLFRNPIIVAIALGLLSSVSGVVPPAMITKIIDMLAVTVGPLALFAIGGGLVGIRLKGMLKDIGLIVGSKLVLHPLMLLLAVLMWPDMDATHKSVAVVLGCLPMFGIYALLGARYGLGRVCSAVLLPATLFSFITLNIAIVATGIWFMS